MEVSPLRHVFYVLLAAAGVFGYQSGAPDKACVSMTPGHYGITPQTTESPYSISVSSLTSGIYEPNETITVTIDGTFQGVLLQARLYDGSSTEPIGTFVSVSSNTKLKSCSNTDDSVTHSNSQEKSSFSTSWKAPSQDSGSIQFRATVAQEKNVFWIGITSLQLEPEASGDCYYAGDWYAAGTTFNATDGCNTCSCFMGAAGCTEMWCSNPNCPLMDCVIDPACPSLQNVTRDGCPMCPYCTSQASSLKVGFMMSLFAVIVACVHV